MNIWLYRVKKAFDTELKECNKNILEKENIKMTKDIQEKLHDGSYRVFKLGRHDGAEFELPEPIEYRAICLRLASTKKSDNWQDNADSWLITINGTGFDYYTGIGHRDKKTDRPQKPELSRVLHSLVMDASACDESFEDWCSNYGYDTDSRKALETYLKCQESTNKLRKAGIFITENIREFLNKY